MLLFIHGLGSRVQAPETTDLVEGADAQLPLDCLCQAPTFEVDAQANGSVVLLEYHGEGHSGICKYL